MSTFLITGGAGFIGSHIVRHLLDRGENVRVLDNLSTGKKENISSLEGKLEFIEGDILDCEALKKAVKGVDYICHQAALPSVSRSVENPAATNDNNIKGTLSVLLAAKEHQVKRFVLASSSSVYGDKEVLPKEESQIPEPRSPYAVSKLTGEHYCNSFWINYGLPTVSLRYFNVFGPRQDPNSDYAAVVPAFISAMVKGRNPVIYGDGKQTRDFTFIENVVEANIRSCQENIKDFGVVMNVSTGDRISVNDLYWKIAEILGRDEKPIYEKPRAGDVKDSQGDPARLKNILKMDKLISFGEGLEKTIEWYKNNI